jgi:hypothetical protein
MRNLKSLDIFAMSKILKKMDIKGELNSEGKSAEEFGRDFFITIMENIGDAEVEFNKFFSSLIGISPEEFADLEIEDMFEIFEQFKAQDGIKRFLQLLK